ncbi:MAG TPA: hypothetical protein VNQ79_05315 [Blastocatellia bacterium]|nr:hypothetical protein [Blastocatellia bacterium]
MTKFLTQLKHRITNSPLWRELRLDEVPSDAAQMEPAPAAPAPIYTTRRTDTGWCVVKREKVVLGPWTDADAERRAHGAARCLNENQRIQKAQRGALA